MFNIIVQTEKHEQVKSMLGIEREVFEAKYLGIHRDEGLRVTTFRTLKSG